MIDQAKILIVDDSADIVEFLADLLKATGYAIYTAGSGPEALEQIERERPDLVLLDVMMPNMTGHEVCRKIRENPATVFLPVVMLTAADANVEWIRGIEAGADDFLKQAAKPSRTAGTCSLPDPNQTAR